MPRTRMQFLSRDKACQAALSHLADLNRITPGWSAPANPEPVYVFQASEAVGLQLPRPPAPSSWLYVGEDGSGTSFTCEINNGPFSEVIGVRYGNAATEVANIRRAARHRPDVQSGDLDFRILRIPELILQGIWLMSNTAGADVILPLGPAFGSYGSGSAAPLDRYLFDRLAAAKKL